MKKSMRNRYSNGRRKRSITRYRCMILLQRMMGMRLDKFLKVSRIIKRRTLAKEISSEGRIKVNDRPAKASSTLTVGDMLEIRFGRSIMTYEVLELIEKAKKDEAERMYKIINEEKIEKDSDF